MGEQEEHEAMPHNLENGERVAGTRMYYALCLDIAQQEKYEARYDPTSRRYKVQWPNPTGGWITMEPYEFDSHFSLIPGAKFKDLVGEGC